jgi:hypothetical protein
MEGVVGGIVTDAFLSQFTLSAILVWLMQKLKEAPWFPVWTAKTQLNVQRAYAAVVAALGAVAINVSFDATAGVLTVTGLTVANVGGSVWSWVQSFVMQQGWYHGIFKPAPPVAGGQLVHEGRKA